MNRSVGNELFECTHSAPLHWQINYYDQMISTSQWWHFSGCYLQSFMVANWSSYHVTVYVQWSHTLPKRSDLCKSIFEIYQRVFRRTVLHFSCLEHYWTSSLVASTSTVIVCSAKKWALVDPNSGAKIVQSQAYPSMLRMICTNRRVPVGRITLWMRLAHSSFFIKTASSLEPCPSLTQVSLRSQHELRWPVTRWKYTMSHHPFWVMVNMKTVTELPKVIPNKSFLQANTIAEITGGIVAAAALGQCLWILCLINLCDHFFLLQFIDRKR